jgi:hypothetical protein
VTVSTGGRSASFSDFTVLPPPDPADITTTGPPRFFHGPQDGTPRTNVQNQPVLVVFAYPTDQDPGTPAQRATRRATEIGIFDNARRFWREASFGSTTWLPNYSDWTALPQHHSFYFWGQADVDEVHGNLLRATARPLTRSGSSILTGASNGFIPVDHPSPLTWNVLPGVAADGSATLALERSGNRLYLGTTNGSLFIYDVTNPGASSFLGSVNIAGASIFGIQLVGSIAVVAAGARGIAAIDVSVPATPSVVNPGAPTTDRATAIKAVGTRIYAGCGTRFRIYDLAGTTLTMVADWSAGAWITGVDVEGSTCAFVTDGGGLRLFTMVPLGLVARADFLQGARLRSVRVAGGRAYIAANSVGLVIVDVSDPAAPVKLAQMATTKPAFGVDVLGTEVVLSAGGGTLVSVDVSNPASPTINGSQMTSSAEVDLSALQAALAVAEDGRGLVKNTNRLFIDALKAYFAATGTTVATLSQFEGIVVLVNGGPVRAVSWVQQGGFGEGVDFSAAKGAYYVNTGRNWGVHAHELGHWLQMPDIYEVLLSDGTFIAGSAAPWCLSGYQDLGALFCSQQLHDQMHWYAAGPATDPNSNVRELTWSPTSALDQTFDLVAHGSSQDTTPNRYHVLKLVAASGLFYYVEVRQADPPGVLFDQELPLPAGDAGRVVVLRSTEGTTLSNSFERPIQLMGALTVGEQIVDAGRNLIVRVEAKLQDDPLMFRVRVQWNQPVVGDPNGAFDLTITPWSTETWETQDIWIDSPRNNPGATPVYEFNDGAPDRPILSGDRPWVNHRNKIYARIRNTGPSAVPEAWVSCYTTSPPGIGDNGSWALLATKKLTNVPGRDPAVPGSGEVIVDFDWSPVSDRHTCLTVAILPQIGEIQTDNNKAQENVSIFQSASGSSHQPVVLEAEVRSPYTVWRKVDLLVRGLPAGWHAVVEHAWVWLPEKGSHPMRAVIYTELGAPWVEPAKVVPLAFPRIEGWTHFNDRYLPIGGILAPVRAVQRAAISVRVEAGGGGISAMGDVDPPTERVPITIEITDASGEALLLYTATNASGQFSANTRTHLKSSLPPGAYSVQAFISTAGTIGLAESDIVAAVIAP